MLNRFGLGAGWLLLAPWLGAAACRKAENGASPSGSASSTSAPLGAAPVTLAGSELSSPTAFELVARGDGLRLVWAAPGGGKDWLWQAELGHDGKPRSAPRRLRLPARSLGAVTDLNAVFVGEQLALAWLETAASEARAQATLLAGDATTLLDLGAAALQAGAPRGNIALAAEREHALVFARALDTPCVDPRARGCTGFNFYRLRAAGAEPTGLPLSVPVPCTSDSAQLISSGGRFHYGVCTLEGDQPVTTMFSIQYDPEYARADPLFKGCKPRGTLQVSGVPWLVVDCAGKRRAARIPFGDEKVQAEALDAPSVVCTGERAIIAQGGFSLTLREPRAGLSAVLPERLSPAGSRAGWTGATLIVVSGAGGKLALSSFVCRDRTLAPLR